jgi:dynactin complex subunit
MSKLVIVIERLTTLFEKVYKTMVNWPKREITGFQYMVKEKFVNTTKSKKELNSFKMSVESSLSFMSLGELGDYKSLLENVLDGTKISFDELKCPHK